MDMDRDAFFFSSFFLKRGGEVDGMGRERECVCVCGIMEWEEVKNYTM